ncbi:hypothetical protein LINPERHAP1_LOCUS31956 [Linum perenne]
MQTPAAPRASVIVLLLLVLVLINNTTISRVEAADRHDTVCIPPKSNGIYNIAYNNDYCGPKNSYLGGQDVELYTYAYCSHGVDREACRDCLVGAAEVIKKKCLNSYGAQASTDECCIRYEGTSFC